MSSIAATGPSSNAAAQSPVALHTNQNPSPPDRQPTAERHATSDVDAD